jgi:hypothetical protein
MRFVKSSSLMLVSFAVLSSCIAKKSASASSKSVTNPHSNADNTVNKPTSEKCFQVSMTKAMVDSTVARATDPELALKLAQHFCGSSCKQMYPTKEFSAESCVQGPFVKKVSDFNEPWIPVDEKDVKAFVASLNQQNCFRISMVSTKTLGSAVARATTLELATKLAQRFCGPGCQLYSTQDTKVPSEECSSGPSVKTVSGVNEPWIYVEKKDVEAFLSSMR